MYQTIPKAIQHLLDKSTNILVIFQCGGGGDEISSALALTAYLREIGKNVTAVSEGFTCPDQYKFLSNTESITDRLPHLQKFSITIDTSEVGVSDHSDKIEDGKLRIFITPMEGRITKDMISVASSAYLYDIIITIGARSFESLGECFFRQGEFFHTTPLINIDHSTDNEHYGDINLIDITKVSTAEVIFDLLKILGKEHITPDMSQALLTGIITQTQSFKSGRITPHTLRSAGELISLGADRESIVTNLYRTRSIATLKLWGTALTNINIINQIGLITTTITRQDFARTGANETDLIGVVNELIVNSPEANTVVVLHEHTDKNIIHCIVTTTNHGNAIDMVRDFHPTGDAKIASFVLHDINLPDAEKTIINHITSIMEDSAN
jgi:nanoRNase/pAp phosphatase (c-di-AMP/oligoRNAs hydrolase)